MISKTNKAKKLLPAWVIPLHAAATFCMLGIMLFFQFVHYPLFHYIGESDFLNFHNNHVVRITPLIGTLMLVELLTGLAIFLKQRTPLWIANFILVLSTWFMTGYWQGPMHTHLSKNYDPKLIEVLIQSNIVRVVVWIIHAVIVFYMLSNLSRRYIEANKGLLPEKF